MKKFVKENLLTIIGAFIGAMAGFLYWKFIGCSTSSCPITSKPLNSTAYGTIMGSLLFSIFQKNKTSK